MTAHAVGEVAGAHARDPRGTARPGLVFVTPPTAGRSRTSWAPSTACCTALALVGCCDGGDRRSPPRGRARRGGRRCSPALAVPCSRVVLGRPTVPAGSGFACRLARGHRLHAPGPCCSPIPSAFLLKRSSPVDHDASRSAPSSAAWHRRRVAREATGCARSTGRARRGGGGTARPGRRRRQGRCPRVAQPFGRPLVVTRPRATSSSSWPASPRWSAWWTQARELTGAEVELLERGGLPCGPGHRRATASLRPRHRPASATCSAPIAADGGRGGRRARPGGHDGAVPPARRRHGQEDLLCSSRADEGRRGAVLHLQRTGHAALRRARPRRRGRWRTQLGPVPMAGYFAAASSVPSGRRNFVHDLTASIALLASTGDRRPRSGQGRRRPTPRPRHRSAASDSAGGHGIPERGEGGTVAR